MALYQVAKLVQSSLAAMKERCSEVLRLAVACLNAKPFVRCDVSRFKLLSSRNSFLITPTPGWDQEEAIRPLAKTRGKRAANRWQSTRLHKGDRP